MIDLILVIGSIVQDNRELIYLIVASVATISFIGILHD